MKRIVFAVIKRQQGYTLIEMIASLALTGILATGVTAFVLQTVTESARCNNHMQATIQVENVGYWVSRDVQMSANITLGENAGFPMQLDWVDINQNEYQVTYTEADGRITRSLVENSGSPAQTIIAMSVNTAPSLTNLTYSDGLLNFNVTSTVGDKEVSRSYQIKKRLDLE